MLIIYIMSQSDYLKQKKMNHVVKSELPQVLSSENYTNYKEHCLVNSIKNTKPLYQQLTQEGNQIVFNMELDVSNCELDKITRTRKPLMVEQTTCMQILKAPGLKVHKTLVKIEDNLDCDCMNHRYQKRILNRINCC